MNNINGLLRRAKEVKKGKGKYIFGFVDYDPEKGKYTVSGTIWDGVPGSGGKSFYSEHDTPEEALAVPDTFVERYPDAKDVRFLVDDFMFPGYVDDETGVQYAKH